jgi:hypothetical protein
MVSISALTLHGMAHAHTHRDPTAQAKLDKLARQRGSIGFGQPPVVPGGMMMFKGYPFNNENTIWEDADDKTAIRCVHVHVHASPRLASHGFMTAPQYHESITVGVDAIS